MNKKITITYIFFSKIVFLNEIIEILKKLFNKSHKYSYLGLSLSDKRALHHQNKVA